MQQPSDNAPSVRKLTEERNSLEKEISNLEPKISERDRKIRELEAKLKDLEDESSGGLFASIVSLLNRVTDDDPRQSLEEEIRKTRQSRDDFSRNLEEKKSRLAEVAEALFRAASQARQESENREKQPQKANPPAPAPAASQIIQKPTGKEEQPQKANPPVPADAPTFPKPAENENRPGKADAPSPSLSGNARNQTDRERQAPASPSLFFTPSSSGTTMDSNQENTFEPQARGNIYLDFSKTDDYQLCSKTNADGSPVKAKTYPGLQGQILKLKQQFGRNFFPDSTEEQLLSDFQEAFFPENVLQEYYISNLSLSQGRPSLCIRPRIIGPRLERLLPQDKTIILRGIPWDNRRDPDNPVFLAQNITLETHFERQPFERSFSGFVFWKRPMGVSRRKDNVFTGEFVKSLPLISVKARESLSGWREYLDWKRRIVSTRQKNIRYIKAGRMENGWICFVTVCQSEKEFDSARKALRNNDSYVWALDSSQNQWQFARRPGESGIKLGDCGKAEKDIPPPEGFSVDSLPWEKPFFARIYFHGTEDSGPVPPQGFLASSVAGDLTLVRRQSEAIDQLEKCSGYAPFLSSYLFDIRTANVPGKLKDVSEWGNSHLNDEQRRAVRTMISAPDIALIQGPPGTGKTTTIAEAIWQLVREGKKVLIVSQASLAVNNVLERLTHDPAIRAIRLAGRKRENEREHPYSREKALATYYRSIADACQKRWLGIWREAEKRKEELDRWLKNFELISADLRFRREACSGIKSGMTPLKEKLAALEKARERSSELAKEKLGIGAFRLFINNNGPHEEQAFPDALPEPILASFHDNILRVLGGLSQNAECPIRKINASWSSPGNGSANTAREALLWWRELAAFRQRIRDDREKLREADIDSMNARRAELLRELEIAEAEMQEDAGKASRYDAIRKEINGIKRQQGAFLDREAYSRFFDTSRIAAFRESNSGQIAAFLEKADGILRKAEPEIAKGIRAVSGAIDRYLGALPGTGFDEKEMRNLKGQAGDLEARYRENALEASAKEEQLKELLEKRPVAFPTEDPSEYAGEVRRELETIEGAIGKTRDFRESWEEILKGWVNDLADAGTAKDDQDNFLDTYIRACNIVGTTCTENRETLEKAKQNQFDTVIVDEVSKATPPEIILPMIMAKTAILVGDHRQLPPLFTEQEGSWEEVIADSDENDMKTELTEQNFERFRKMVTSSLFKEHFEKAPDSIKSSLKMQFRMHPQIMRVINQFYENRLRCGLEEPYGACEHGLSLTGENSLKYVTPNQHAVWIDSTFDPYRHPHMEERRGSSRINNLECILIAKILYDIELACRKQGFGANGKQKKEVGIISFYGRQIGNIRKAIQHIQNLYGFTFTALRYDVNTVDKYQGQERPIVLVSMVRNPRGFLSKRANIAQFERINVAFSRAQQLLIILGAKRVFSDYEVRLPNLNCPGERIVNVYRNIIGEIQLNGGVARADTVAPQKYYDEMISYLKQGYEDETKR